ncbi:MULTISPECIES: type III secretion system helper protein HrpK1 [Pseudomonas syringae group]|uniref:Pathogenicity locus protein HrpK n=2 Tax=Pseudomonas syringae group TaxID=136849 RepID=A0ABY1U3G2_PSESX|nr:MULTISPECIES: type III secretion system helper protein HrpK1 [Pseudomonas syringae group]KWT13601.1 type III effector HrpK [Pseudomonas syringae pv. avii]POQ05811.1 type III effector HrpK [Pseudomonas syringae pv. avii]RMR21268.1 Type III helper protein HrpK1 [Pseudomonas syringae pv. persicae]SOQ07471.1 type III helper protein HrpK1 [Pseudomonas syringae pv. persicae]SOQ07524.1 type III helper protein HrpK1 [Pseudomonas syringae pv. persicae]
MRISSSPFVIVNQPTPGELALAVESPLAKALPTPAGGGGQAGVQFGQPAGNTQGAPTGAEQTASSILALLLQGSGGAAANVNVNNQVQPQPCADSPAEAAPTEATAPAAPVEQVAAPTNTDATDASNAPKAADAAFLDNSEYSSPEALKRWEPMVAHLPPEEREQAAKELNRPIAAAWMARDDGPDAGKAMDFINANPALKTAVDVAQGGGNADGKITNKDLKTFAKNMEKAADSADKDLANYTKDNPDADPQSLEMVRSAAVMRANMPLAIAADPHHAVDAADKTKVDGNVDAEDLKGLAQSNPGLSGALKQSCSTWSQPGFLGQVDEAGMSGRKKAAHSPDKMFDAKNLSEWIKKSAPTNGGQFASMLSDSATLNAVAGIDISKLDKDVFDKPKSYSGAQKAAVMVKLQQTQQSVIAGRSLRNTDKTEQGLNDRISQLQADPDVQAYLNKSIPEQERNLVRSDASLQKAVVEQTKNVNSGQALQTDMDKADKAVNKHNPNADYSGAISGLSAQLQLQKDLFPDSKVPTTNQVLENKPDLQDKIATSYVTNFSEGGALKQLLGQKKSDASQSLQTADNQKAIYDSVLPPDFTENQHENYMNSTLGTLQDSKKGRKLLEGKSDEGGPSMLTQLAEAGVGGKALNSIVGFASVSSLIAHGDKLGATQAIYDSTRMGAEAIKGGIDAGAKMMGREASAGLGRLGGQMIGRAVGMVAGEATGLAAGAALGAAIPVVGWAIDGALAVGFGISMIIDAVKKHKAQKAFDHNVDPVLDQFGIAKAH